MCLALPTEIIEIIEETDMAIVSLEGVKKEISLALIEDAKVGEFVLVHVGYALNKVSQEEAERTLSLMSDAGLILHDEAKVAE